LTSSAVEPTSFSDDYTLEELESVDLNSATTKGLPDSQIRFVKTRVLLANEALGVAGNAIYAAARSLVEIKKDVKKKNWVALTDSGVLSMSGRNARDLALAYETWLSASDIPEDALSQVSARTLAKIGKAEAGQRVHAINKIKKGDGFSEGDLNKILKKKSKVNVSMEELLAKAELVSKKTSDEDKIGTFTDIMLQNIKLKQKVADLEAELKTYKAKV
tara:strand:+ start:182 stop:835 length:654 start_codon:yes stop_codon:yes gene_type:complete